MGLCFFWNLSLHELLCPTSSAWGPCFTHESWWKCDDGKIGSIEKYLALHLFLADDISLRYSGPAATSFKSQLDELAEKDAQKFPSVDGFIQSLQPSSPYPSLISVNTPCDTPQYTAGNSHGSRLTKLGIKKSLITTDKNSSPSPIDFDQLTQKAAEVSLSKSPFSASSPKSIPGQTQSASSSISQEPLFATSFCQEGESDDRLGMGNMRRHKLAPNSGSSVSSSSLSKDTRGTSSSDYFSSNKEHEERQSLERLRSLQGAQSISSEDFDPSPANTVNKHNSLSPSSSFNDLTQAGIETLKDFLSKSKSKVRNIEFYL
ncbi:hypothetical protein DI09_35p160 [Mitosporidium daphniae]|uniref:Uncharacterized protein n=1 Tax=Mitosporidium daphniae TaxID=1485682 RepID=A0A098VQX3_9MICR|nr:uncharacterized protein DI09_35p160 [Mitosporidium daphniae]KGG51428.1 hypothetical protein DI09_35p160 [Mitosporidium daphniae]|eukprot:XP_013237855.1 uncharacterized protein DI09_35p160 [Mitosporidium daphniae]